MKQIFEINEKIRRIAELLPIVPVPENVKAEIRKNIEDGMILIKVAEKSVLWRHTAKEIYLIGKVFGRMEAIYSLIAKGVKDVREEK